MAVAPGTKVTIPFRFVASAGENNDWAVYMGWSAWTDERIAREGSKVPETLGRALAAQVVGLIPEFQGFLDLIWRR